MEDFNALASALGADLAGVRACLIVSRDGLVLGAHPADGEAIAKAAWSRFVATGEPDRGFLQFATETWCWERRGPYGAFALAEPAVRAGLVLDAMERVLLAAEEARADRSAVRSEAPPVAAAVAPASKPRASLHPEAPKPAEPVVQIDAALASEPTAAIQDDAAPEAAPPAGPTPDAADVFAVPVAEESGVWANERDDEGIDTYSLTKELGRLLQGEGGGADG
jgi:hypothetical protein